MQAHIIITVYVVVDYIYSWWASEFYWGFTSSQCLHLYSSIG